MMPVQGFNSSDVCAENVRMGEEDVEKQSRWRSVDTFFCMRNLRKKASEALQRFL